MVIFFLLHFFCFSLPPSLPPPSSSLSSSLSCFSLFIFFPSLLLCHSLLPHLPAPCLPPSSSFPPLSLCRSLLPPLHTLTVYRYHCFPRHLGKVHPALIKLRSLSKGMNRWLNQQTLFFHAVVVEACTTLHTDTVINTFLPAHWACLLSKWPAAGRKIG